MKINQNFKQVKDSYLFSNVAARVSAFTQANPDADVIRLGIGDVTLPLCPAVVEALKSAAAEMGEAKSFRGYGPEQGYDFLRQAVVDLYAERKVSLLSEEVFISDGAKSDLGNILDLFETDNTVLIPDPVYPVYVDCNLMAGRQVTFLDANAENGFLPGPDKNVHADIIYLCSPNNPTGAAYTREGLKAWVDYAREHEAVILFDAAYSTFIRDDKLPKSIYEIPGAEECAIEINSFSKSAGFTGVRCGYTVVPTTLAGDGKELNRMWLRRQTTKFNGVPYITQRAAAAALSKEGRQQTSQAVDIYRSNAAIMAEVLAELGIYYTGGQHSPYVWMRCPNRLSSWEYFDRLLSVAHVVGTPGVGFGKNGEGYFRLTAFNTRERTIEAMQRIKTRMV
jgi:LL-diaminopimelate aminotransferase